MNRQRFEDLVSEAFDLRHEPRLCRAAVEELIVEWDRSLRSHQTTLAVYRVLRDTNPARVRGAA